MAAIRKVNLLTPCPSPKPILVPNFPSIIVLPRLVVSRVTNLLDPVFFAPRQNPIQMRRNSSNMLIPWILT